MSEIRKCTPAMCRVALLTEQEAQKAANRYIDKLVIDFDETKDPGEMDGIQRQLSSLASKKSATAKKVVDSLALWLKKVEGKKITKESRLKELYVIGILRDIGHKAKVMEKGSPLWKSVVETLKKVAKGNYSPETTKSANNILVDLRVPGYSYKE